MDGPEGRQMMSKSTQVRVSVFCRDTAAQKYEEFQIRETVPPLQKQRFQEIVAEEIREVARA
jgi:hypothetical protein